MLKVLKSDHVDWKKLHVTKALVERLFIRREEVKEAWIQGKLTAENPEYVRGFAMAFKEVIDYIIDDFEVESEDVEVAEHD